MVHINDSSVVKHPKLRSELINFEDETGLWWTENWQLWTVYLKKCHLLNYSLSQSDWKFIVDDRHWTSFTTSGRLPLKFVMYFKMEEMNMSNELFCIPFDSMPNWLAVDINMKYFNSSTTFIFIKKILFTFIFLRKTNEDRVKLCTLSHTIITILGV